MRSGEVRPAGLLPRAVREEEKSLRFLRRVAQGVDITEIYNPKIITEEAEKFGLSSGLAMDLVTGWNFDRREDRRNATNRWKITCKSALP